jgi:glycerophosphoryl diester phosphodiesterase
MPRRARENTLPSFALAIEAGADGLELDVHATSDGVVVVHHDPAVAHGPEIAAVRHAELRRFEAAPGIPIPTLAELCEMVAGRVGLFVEIKGAEIERLVLGALAGYGGDVAIHSFDHATIARLHAARAPYPLGILIEDRGHDVARSLRETGASDVWPHWTIVTPALVTEVHDAGGRVIPWTVNDVAAARRLSDLGVDALCGDDVGLLPTA